MRIIYLLSLLYLAACSSTSNERPTETLSVNSLADTSGMFETNKLTMSEPPKLEWSKFLGHFFKYIPYDTIRYKLPEVSKKYYDFRFGDNTLVTMKCQDFGNCGDKLILMFNRISGDSVIFQPSKTTGTQSRTFSFYQNSVFVNEPNDSTLNWETVRYEVYIRNYEEEEYEH